MMIYLLIFIAGFITAHFFRALIGLFKKSVSEVAQNVQKDLQSK